MGADIARVAIRIERGERPAVRKIFVPRPRSRAFVAISVDEQRNRICAALLARRSDGGKRAAVAQVSQLFHSPLSLSSRGF